MDKEKLCTKCKEDKPAGKPIEIKPTKPKENGYLYKPVGGVNDPII